MKPFAAALAVLLSCMIASAATAQQWATGTAALPGGTLYQTGISDGTGQFQLVFICDDQSKRRTAMVIGPEQFDPDAGYADLAPTQLTAGGLKVDFDAEYRRIGDRMGISHHETAPLFDSLYMMVIYASSPIEVSFFGRNASFSAKGARDGITWVENGCGAAPMVAPF